MVKANYFAIQSKLKWQVYHYRVDFSPEIEAPTFRNALLARQRSTLGTFIYDRGSAIYKTHALTNDETEIITRDRDEREILIKLKLVEIISPLEHRAIHFQNVIIKKALRALHLDRVGRDYFDAQAAVSYSIRDHPKRTFNIIHSVICCIDRL